MTKCIILDDEENCRVALRELLKRHAPDFELIYHSDDAHGAYQLIADETFKPDVVFLDIQMPKCDGFAFLKKFDHIPFKVVFTTAYDQYAIKAIRFSAIDYLLKPIDTEDLLPALDKCRNVAGMESINNFRNSLKNNRVFDKLAIPSASDVSFIDISDIMQLEGSNNYTTVVLANGSKLTSSKNIGYYEEMLEDLHFFRVHNSHIINLKRIKRYIKGKAPYVELENGIQVAISTRRKDEFVRLMNF